MLNTMFGASILSLPYVVKISGGVLPYLILLTCVAIGNGTSMAVLGMYGVSASVKIDSVGFRSAVLSFNEIFSLRAKEVECFRPQNIWSVGEVRGGQ